MQLRPERWVVEFIDLLLQRHPEIEQVYLLGKDARGPQGQKPNYSVLLYAGYDRALGLLTELAREEDEIRPTDGILHLYVENYGATMCGIWGGSLITNEVNRDWIEEIDYQLLTERGDNARPLIERLHLPEERRNADRRLGDLSPEGSRESDALSLFFTEDRRQVPDRRRQHMDHAAAQ